MSITVAEEHGSVDRLDVRAEIAWDIPEDTSCPLAKLLDGNPTEVMINHVNGTCYLEVELEEYPEGGTSNKLKLQGEVGNCSCPAFWKNGCHPRYRLVDEMMAVAEVYLSSRETLRSLVSDLRRTGRNPSIRNLTLAGETEGIADIRTINIESLTDCEKQCLEYAIEEGYYDRNRTISLQDIADEFDVSKSTCSERLGSAESKIVKELFAE